MLLPLDYLTDEVKKGLEYHNVSPDDITLAVELDLTMSGHYGDTWLLADDKAKKLYYMSVELDTETALLMNRTEEFREKELKIKTVVDPEKYKDAEFISYDFSELDFLYIDNYITSCQLLCKMDGEVTKVITNSTNARKRRLFAFVDVLKRIIDGDTPKEDDAIFEQFHAKCPKCGKEFPNQNNKICPDCNQKGHALRRVMVYGKKYVKEYIAIIMMMVATALLSLLNPIVSGKLLYDQVINEEGALHTESWVVASVLILFFMWVLSIFITIIQNLITDRLSYRLTLDMKLDVYKAIQRMSMAYYNNNPSGRLITKINSDPAQIRSFFTDGLPVMLINSLKFIGLTIFLFVLNWKLTLIVFIPIPIIYLIFKLRIPKLWRMQSLLWRRSSALNVVLTGALNGVRVVKAFSKEAEETDRFSRFCDKFYSTYLKQQLLSMTIGPVVSLLISITSMLIWGFGGFEVMGLTMTYGEFHAYIGYVAMIFVPIQFFSSFTILVTSTLNSAKRMFEVLDEVPEVSECADAVEMDKLRGDIVFDKVCFHYLPARPILKNVSMTIHSKDNIGLVGHTGSGKSTIANLMSRMYDVISGLITIDGVDIRNIKPASLRKNIAIVSQEIFLFRGSLAENIRYAKPDATMEEVIAAAKAANAHEFIMNLPNGYDTMVGHGSRSLSGGQRQRISIARALLLAPSILILDEATAAMDTETERQIQGAIEALSKDRTTISIAHRLSTLKDCNYLFVIEDGKIEEEGTPEELIAKKGMFYRLYTLQNKAMQKMLQGM